MPRALWLMAASFVAGIVCLVTALWPFELAWVCGPDNATVSRALFPVAFLCITSLYLAAIKLGLVRGSTMLLLVDALSYALVFLVQGRVLETASWHGLSWELGCIFVVAVELKLGLLAAAVARRALSADWWLDRHRLIGLFLLDFLLFFLVGLYTATKVPAQPDEPFYLLIAQSLLYDGDLDLNNNLEARQYLPYYPSVLLPQQDVNRKGRYVSRHGIVFPLLLAPFFALGGRIGAMILPCFAYALFCVLVAKAAAILTGSGSAAFATWTVAALSTPGFIYSTQIYPESLACLLVMVLLGQLASRNLGRNRALPLVAAAVLPWLKPRYALIALPICLLIFARALGAKPPGSTAGTGRHRLASSSVLLAAGAFSIAAALVFGRAVLFRFFGAMNFGDVLHLGWSKSWFRLFGLGLDYRYGLLVYSPVFLIALLGFLVSARRSGQLAKVTVFSLGPYLFTLGAVHWWYGGGCPPGRYLVCLLPFILLCFAKGWAFAKGAMGRSAFGVLVAWTVTSTTLLAIFPKRRYPGTPLGGNGLVDILAPLWAKSNALPSFVDANAASYVWAIALAALALLLYLRLKRITKRLLKPCPAIIDVDLLDEAAYSGENRSWGSHEPSEREQ